MAAKKAKISKGVIQGLPKGAQGKIVGSVVTPAPRLEPKPEGVKKSVFEALVEKISVKKHGITELDEVKAGVLNELKSFKGEGSSWSSGPFRHVLLPEHPAPKSSKPWVWLVPAGVAAGLIGFLFFVQPHTVSGPESSIVALESSFYQHDFKTFETLVDVPSLSRSFVDVFYGNKIPEGLKVVGSSSLAKNSQDVKLGLADMVGDEVRQLVETGKVGPVLSPVVADLSLKDARLGRPKMVMGDPGVALVDVPLYVVDRPDSALRFVLKSGASGWKVTEVVNLAQTVAFLKADVAKVEPAAGISAEKIVSDVRLVDALKQPLDKVGDAVSFPVEVHLANTGGVNYSNLLVKLVFGDAEGRVLKVFETTASVEGGRVVPLKVDIPLDKNNNLDVAVATLPLSAMTLRAEVFSTK